jgi:NDP-sugar pyrophosphorylase family protein
MIADGRVVRAVDMRGFWSDVGTPEDLEKARAWFKPKGKRR